MGLAAIAMVGCDRSSPPEDPPDLAGVISQISGSKILVAHTEDDCGRTQFGHDRQTEVLLEGADGQLEPSSWAALKEGEEVELWQGDALLASCPGQTTAAKVIVLSSSNYTAIDVPVRAKTLLMPTVGRILYRLEGHEGREFGRLVVFCNRHGVPKTAWEMRPKSPYAAVVVKGRGTSVMRPAIAGDRIEGGSGNGTEAWIVNLDVQPESYRLNGILSAHGGDSCSFELTGRLTGINRL